MTTKFFWSFHQIPPPLFWGDDAVISLPAFLYRSNPKLQSYLATPKFIKKIIINLDLPMVSGADCITLVVLDNCEPELSFMLAELFNIFSRSLEGSIYGPVIKNVGGEFYS